MAVISEERDYIVLRWEDLGVPVQLEGRRVLIDKVFANDFPRQDAVTRAICVRGSPTKGRALEEVVDEIFREVVRGDEGLLLKVTEEACQTGAAPLLIHMVDQYTRRYEQRPYIEKPTVFTNIFRTSEGVYVSVDVEGRALVDVEQDPLREPRVFQGNILYKVVLERTTQVSTCIEMSKLDIIAQHASKV